MRYFYEDAIAEALEEHRIRGWIGIEAFAGDPPWEQPKRGFEAMREYVDGIQAAYAKVAWLEDVLVERADAYDKGGMGGRAAECRAMVELFRSVKR